MVGEGVGGVSAGFIMVMRRANALRGSVRARVEACWRWRRRAGAGFGRQHPKHTQHSLTQTQHTRLPYSVGGTVLIPLCLPTPLGSSSSSRVTYGGQQLAAGGRTNLSLVSLSFSLSPQCLC